MKRYEKQILLEEIGEEGQRRIMRGSVAIIGCGALGSHVANLLARAGVGRIRLIDRDFVEIDNLHRHALFDEEDARNAMPKAIAAKQKLQKINSEIEVDAVVADVNASNVEKLIEGVDIVIDALDNMETRFLINDACIKHNIPWIHGAVVATEGFTMNILPGRTACLRCLLPSLPSPASLPTCDTAGVMGSVVAIVASLEATEAIKFLAGRKMRREAVHVDVWKATWLPIKVERRKDCMACGRKKFEFLDGKETDVAVLCGRNAVQVKPGKEANIDFNELANRLKNVADDVFSTDYMLRFRVEGKEVVVFEDGRAIIKGVGDVAKAKAIYSKYIGL